MNESQAEAFVVCQTKDCLLKGLSTDSLAGAFACHRGRKRVSKQTWAETDKGSPWALAESCKYTLCAGRPGEASALVTGPGFLTDLNTKNSAGTVRIQMQFSAAGELAVFETDKDMNNIEKPLQSGLDVQDLQVGVSRTASKVVHSCVSFS